MIVNRTPEGVSEIARSLADLLSGRGGEEPARLSGAELERLGLALCEALEALHAAGETHGSLRPSVVQVMSDGAVTLLPSADSSAQVPRLQYAAPEVARGGQPTPASDVFSLALILFELFDGGPARVGDAGEIRGLAEDGVAPIPDALPRRLGNLAARSVLADPKLRPTAAAWRSALGSPSRVSAAQRSPLALLGLAVIGLIVALGWSQRNAAEASDRAEARILDARGAFEGLLLGTYDELERVEAIAPLAAAGARALAAIEGAPGATTPRDRELLAVALVWNGRAQRRLGDPEAAKVHFMRAVDAAGALPPGTVATETEVAARIALAELAVEQRDFKAGRAHYDRAVRLCQDAISSGGADRALRVDQVRALIGLGDVTMSSGNQSAERALKVFGRARAALEAPGIGGEADALDLMVLRCDLGKLEASMAFKSGQRERAVELLEGHVLLARKLVERDPGSPRSRWTLARGADVLARAQREVGQPQAAVRSHRVSVEAWRLLREMEPRNDAWRREWAKSTALLADSLRMVGAVEESVELHGESVRVMESMIGAGELSAAFRLNVIGQELSAAEGLLAAGEVRSARARLMGARRRLGKLPPAERTDRRGTDLGIRSTLVEAEVLLAEGRWATAGEKTLVVMQRIQQRSLAGTDRPLRLDRARALLVSGAVKVVEGDEELATNMRERALGVIDELRRERPKDPELIALRARALFTLGRDAAGEKAAEGLDRIGYRDARLSAVRAASRQLRR